MFYEIKILPNKINYNTEFYVLSKENLISNIIQGNKNKYRKEKWRHFLIYIFEMINLTPKD
jgi:hypothetical protein